MAMEKLGQLHREAVESGQWDLIVVDTPPSRSALDFLDAPANLASFWHYDFPHDRSPNLRRIGRIARELDHVLAAILLDLNQVAVHLDFNRVPAARVDLQFSDGGAHDDRRALGDRASGKKRNLKEERSRKRDKDPTLHLAVPTN
jgi:hypothetical protein